MAEKKDFPDFEREEKTRVRKATTLYLNNDNYQFVKNRLKKPISVFVDELLQQVRDFMEQKEKDEEGKNMAKKEEGEDET